MVRVMVMGRRVVVRVVRAVVRVRRRESMMVRVMVRRMGSILERRWWWRR